MDDGWAGFGAAFAAVFLAELGDRTQLSLLIAATQVDRPWTLLCAASIAFALSNALAVTLGAALSAWIPRAYLLLGSGVLFLLFGIWFAYVAIRHREDDESPLEIPDRRLLVGVAIAILVAEMGDKTQIATALLSASHLPVAVFVGATVALVLSAALAIVLGRLLRRLPSAARRWIRPVSALLFIGFGVAYVVQAVEH